MSDITLSDASLPIKNKVNELIKAGKSVKCPVCSHRIGPVRYGLRPQWCQVLVCMSLFFKSNPTKKWVYVEGLLRNLGIHNRNFTRLALWGLIEPYASKDDKDKGFWRLTPKGEKFVVGSFQLKPYLLLQGGEVIWPEAKPQSIEELLNNGKMSLQAIEKQYKQVFKKKWTFGFK